MRGNGDKGLRVGVVGCGNMGMKHLRVLAESPQIASVAACDSCVAHLADIPLSLISRDGRYGNHLEMYERTAPDLVVVATPPVERVTPVTDALERGIAVLCEKPFASSLKDADDMVEAAARSGEMLAVHHQYRLSSALDQCRSMIAAGAIGTLVMLRGRCKGGRRGGIELLELGTHLADIMTILAGPAQWCSATVYEGHRLARVDDVRPCPAVAPEQADLGPVVGTRVAASYGFPEGVSGELHYLGYENRMAANYGVDILGTSGQLALRCSRHIQSPLWYLARPMEGTPGQCGDWQAVDVPGNGNQHLVEDFYRAIFDALQGGRPAPCLGTDGRRALEMVHAAYQSHRQSGRRIMLPLVERGHALLSWKAEAGWEPDQGRGTETF